MVTQENNVTISEELTNPATNGAETTQAGEESKMTNGKAPGVNGDSPTDSEQSGPTEADQIAELQTELKSAQAKADDLLDKLQRTVAEAQNSRRRQERQLAEELERASARIIRRLLPVVDDFSLAFQNVPGELDNSTSGWVDGFRQIQKKLGALLEDEGVTPIAADGEFDPNRHEAVTSEPHETIASGHIIDTLRTGYEYKGRVLRPSLVRVAL